MAQTILLRPIEERSDSIRSLHSDLVDQVEQRMNGSVYSNKHIPDEPMKEFGYITHIRGEYETHFEGSPVLSVTTEYCKTRSSRYPDFVDCYVKIQNSASTDEVLGQMQEGLEGKFKKI